MTNGKFPIWKDLTIKKVYDNYISNKQPSRLSSNNLKLRPPVLCAVFIIGVWYYWLSFPVTFKNQPGRAYAISNKILINRFGPVFRKNLV